MVDRTMYVGDSKERALLDLERTGEYYDITVELSSLYGDDERLMEHDYDLGRLALTLSSDSPVRLDAFEQAILTRMAETTQQDGEDDEAQDLVDASWEL